MLTRRSGLALGTALIIATGTSCSAPDESDSPPEFVGTTTQAGVAVTCTHAGQEQCNATQSETSISVHNGIITILHNDETGEQESGKITFTPTDRTVVAGASLFGWAYYDGTWKGGKLRPLPTDEWLIYWGDPAIAPAWSAESTTVFATQLAVHTSKYTGPITGGLNNYISGAVIAKSTDNGKTFSFYQGVHDSYKFYDGASMAAGPNGEFYVAYRNVTNDQIHVYKAANDTSPFVKMSNPFGGKTMVHHPRLRVASDGNVYVASQSLTGTVWVHRTTSPGATTWGPEGSSANPATLLPGTVSLNTRLYRMGPQFSFDIGSPSVNNDDAVRILYTQWSGSRYFVRATRCKADLTGCTESSEWSSLSDVGDQVNPLVEFDHTYGTGKWKVVYKTRQTDPTGDTLAIMGGELAVSGGGARTMPRSMVEGTELVCSDLRGYWGDYDDLKVESSSGGVTLFIHAFTRSVDLPTNCAKRWQFTAEPMHVSCVHF